MSGNGQRPPPRPPGDQRPPRPVAPGDPRLQGPRGAQTVGQIQGMRPAPPGPPRQLAPGTQTPVPRPLMPQRSPSDLARPQMPTRAPSDLGARPKVLAARPGVPPVQLTSPSQVRPGPFATRPQGIVAHPQGQAASMGVSGRAGLPQMAVSVPGRAGLRPPTGEILGRAGPLGRAAPPTGMTPTRPAGVRTDESVMGENMRALAIATASGSGSGSGSAEASKGSGGSGNLLPQLLPLGRAAMEGRRKLLKTRPETRETKKGAVGSAVTLTSNYFQLKTLPTWRLYQHSVDFSPEEDSKLIRKQLFRQLEPILGKTIFDGAMLFSPKPLAAEQPAVHDVKHPADGSFVKIRIRYVGELEKDSFQFTQVLNIIMRQVLAALELKEIQRNYFNPNAKVELPTQGLEIWPGYKTSLRQHETFPLLCCEISNKILRLETVRDMMYKWMNQHGANYQAVIKRNLIGQIVLTRYNYKTLRIDDVDFANNPKSTFENPKSAGGRQNLIQYYANKYKIKIRDEDQPLLVSFPTARDKRRGMDTPKWLIPEHCSLTGLSDDQRADFRLMSAVQEHTRTNPPQRVSKLLDFIRQMNSNPKAKQELANWDVSIDDNLVKLQGRLLDPELICGGQNQSIKYQSQNAEWQGVFRNKLWSAVPCQKWAIIYPTREEPVVTKFVKELLKAASGMGFPLRGPKECPIGETRTPIYISELRKVLNMGPDLVMVIVPNNKGDTYHTVKKVTYVESPKASQVVTLTVLNKGNAKNGLGPIATKVAAQMAAKMGAELWTVKIPLKGLMVVGYDTWHDTSKKDISIGAIVCTLNQTLTKSISYTTRHKNGEELCAQFKSHLMSAFDAYKRYNGDLPTRIIIYRDGVGEGQIEQLLSVEVNPLQAALMKITPELKFTYVIVSKRINTRFFMDTNPPENPKSGTVVDDVVTLPERYDFFLVSQSVRQGTVNPTSYNVVSDNSTLKPEHLQQLTYKLTHLYYNWPGVVRVPSVCQYAHKLAYLVGESLHTSPSPVLGQTLFYL